MINLISNDDKAKNAPDHPVYMMCIRVAYAHACVRACVWFGMHLYVYKLNVDTSLKRDFFNQRVSNYLVCLFIPLSFISL